MHHVCACKCAMCVLLLWMLIWISLSFGLSMVMASSYRHSLRKWIWSHRLNCTTACSTSSAAFHVVLVVRLGAVHLLRSRGPVWSSHWLFYRYLCRTIWCWATFAHPSCHHGHRGIYGVPKHTRWQSTLIAHVCSAPTATKTTDPLWQAW